MRDDGLRLTWSVRDAADDDDAAERVLTDLSQVCRDVCSMQFDADAGYSLVHRRLWGAIEGSTTQVRRGSFVAVLGVQRFSRRDLGDAAGSEFRVVAEAHHTGTHALARRSVRRDALWLMLAGAAGTTGLGFVGLMFAGLLTTWGQLLLLLPLLMVWRMTLALRFADDLRRDAQRCAIDATGVGSAPRVSAGAADDLARWRRVLETVALQREAVAEAFCGQGFRIPGAMPGSVAALAAGPLAPPPLQRALPVPDLAMPPLGRTTAL